MHLQLAERGIVALRKKATALLLDNVISLLFLLVWIMGILRWRRGRREERGDARPWRYELRRGCSSSECMRWRCKTRRDLFVAISALFPYISGRRNFRPMRSRKRTGVWLARIDLKFDTSNERGNVRKERRRAPQIVVWLVILSWERKPGLFAQKSY